MLERISGEPVFQRKGILVNKVYAAGILPGFFPVKTLIKSVLSYPVSSALIGIGSAEQAEAETFRERRLLRILNRCCLYLRKHLSRSPVTAARNAIVRTEQKFIPFSGSIIIISWERITGRCASWIWELKKVLRCAENVRICPVFRCVREESGFRTGWKRRQSL